MKIAILTLPIHSNFGYLMQMYALQFIVKELGHEPYTFYIKKGESTFFAKLKETIYNLYLRFYKGKKVIIFKRWLSDKDLAFLDTNTWNFINTNIVLTEFFKSPSDFYHFDTNKYDAYIVGSDQVWREPYSISLPLFFFSFLKKKQKRMSYAASFGKGDINEYSRKQKKVCCQLLKRFDLITVREESGVDICRTEFGVNAKQVVDPTLLVKPEEYLKMADRGVSHNHGNPYLFIYMLDMHEDRLTVIRNFAQMNNLAIVNLLPQPIPNNATNLERYRYPHVYDILSGIANSTYIITDSFHVSVFSILFKRQFYVFPNKKRGISRIESLLNNYSLSNRIITNGTFVTSLIDYKTIESKIENNRAYSIKLLSSFVNGN